MLHPLSSQSSMDKPVYSSHDRLTKSTEPSGRAVQAIVGIVSITSRSRCSVRRNASAASLLSVISASHFATRSIGSIGLGILPVGSLGVVCDEGPLVSSSLNPFSGMCVSGIMMGRTGYCEGSSVKNRISLNNVNGGILDASS